MIRTPPPPPGHKYLTGGRLGVDPGLHNSWATVIIIVKLMLNKELNFEQFYQDSRKKFWDSKSFNIFFIEKTEICILKKMQQFPLPSFHIVKQMVYSKLFFHIRKCQKKLVISWYADWQIRLNTRLSRGIFTSFLIYVKHFRSVSYCTVIFSVNFCFLPTFFTYSWWDRFWKHGTFRLVKT